MRDLFEFVGAILAAVINTVILPLVLLAEVFLLAILVHRFLKRAFPVWLRALHLIRPAHVVRTPQVGVAVDAIFH